MATQRYEFQPPTNIVAIRSSILQRLKKRTSNVITPPTPPPQANEYEEKLAYLHLDNGLPSPPIETCCFEEEEDTTTTTTTIAKVDMVVNVVELTPSSCAPADTKLESSSVIRERIRLLKEEKHKLFQVMKDLLSTPPIKEEAEQKQQQQSSPVTTRPVIRSRSISHSESTRPISRYYDRPRFYNNNGYYPYQPSANVSFIYIFI